MELVDRRRIGPHFFAHTCDGVGIELADIGGRFRIHPTARHDRLGATLFERCIVEISVGTCGHHFECERRGLGQIARNDIDLTADQSAQQMLEPVRIHGFFQTIAQCLLHERMIGHFDVADDVLAARDLIRKHGGEQILRVHACERRRHFLAAAKARQPECNRCDPAPARGEHRRIEQRLNQQLARSIRMQIARDIAQLEAVCGRERQNDRVFRCGGLQLEIETATETFTQCEPPRAVDAAAERRVNDELHAAGFIEEAFEDDALLRRQMTERGVAGTQVFEELSTGGIGKAQLIDEPMIRACQPAAALIAILRTNTRELHLQPLAQR